MANNTLHLAKLQQGVADTLAKQVTLLEVSAPPVATPSLSTESSTPSSYFEASGQPVPRSHDSETVAEPNGRGLPPSIAHSRPEQAQARVERPSFQTSVPSALRQQETDVAAGGGSQQAKNPACRSRGGLQEWDTYLLPTTASVKGKVAEMNVNRPRRPSYKQNKEHVISFCKEKSLHAQC